MSTLSKISVFILSMVWLAVIYTAAVPPETKEKITSIAADIAVVGIIIAVVLVLTVASLFAAAIEKIWNFLNR